MNTFNRKYLRAKQPLLQNIGSSIEPHKPASYGPDVHRWISWDFLLWNLEGITLPCGLLIGQYAHYMIFCPLISMVKNAMESIYICGIRLSNVPENTS